MAIRKKRSRDRCAVEKRFYLLINAKGTSAEVNVESDARVFCELNRFHYHFPTAQIGDKKLKDIQ